MNASGTISFNEPSGVNNRVSVFGYDAAGNLLSDGSNSYCSGGEAYNYNAEGQMSCAAGIAYTYDGDGGRVKKSSGTLYWGGEEGAALAESDLSGNITSEYIFVNGKRIARKDASGTVYYYLSDHLGSSSVLTNATGTIENESDFYPYGVEHEVTQNLSNHYKFTGKERDTESGNDYFGARYYGSTMGRFLSPDWSAKEEPVPYAKLDDPQSLNLYAYVRNNPLTRVDPDGHCGGYNPATGQMYCPSDDLKHPVWASVPQKFKLPNDPSGLGPEWTQDTGHKNPNGSKWKNPDGWDLEFHKGKQGAKGFRGKDHWHLTPPGAEEKDDEHLAPGTEVTVTVPDPKPEPAAEPEDSRSAMDKVNDWLNDHLPQGVKDYLRDHPYGPNSSPGPGPAYSPPPIWAEPW
jgi:RHS repeat-associated protein